MSPTVPTGNNVDKRPNVHKPSTERRSDFICRVKYCNTLPDIPFDPKFITYPFESTRFIQYNPTSLERNYKYEVLTEHDLGVTIDLINKDMYLADPDAVLDPADERLLEEDVLTLHDSKRSRHHSRSVSWLRRTEYISTEQTRYQPQTMDKVEAKVGYSIKKSLKEDTLSMDRDSQIKAIEKTFTDAKTPIEKHYSKPNVTAVEVLPLFPDFKLWKYPCAQVMFDSDPAPVGMSVPAQLEEMSQAVIRGVMDESGEQFVAYFLPTAETLEKRRRDFVNGIDYEDDEEYEYKIAREYNWNVKTKASKGYEENYFLIFRQDGVYFNELETRVRLSKRRQKANSQPNNTRLIVKHIPLTAAEFNIHRQREKQLEPHIEEEDEEEDEEEEDQAHEEKKENGGKEDDSGSEKASRSGKGSDSEKDKSGSESGSEASDKEESDKDTEKRSRANSVSDGGEQSDRSKTRSQSRSKSRSKSHSASRSRSRSKSRSRSASRSPSRSKSRSPSRSKSRSKSPSRSKSRSKSPSRSRSSSSSSAQSSRSGSDDD